MPPSTTLREGMQQVRSLATRGSTYVREKYSAFNNYLSGFKRTRSNSDDQNWSTSTSERNLSRGSSKKRL